MEPLSPRTSHAVHTFPLLNRLNSPHELSTRSWTLSGDTWLTPDSVTQMIFEVRLFYLTVPALDALLESVWFAFTLLGWLGPLLGLICPPLLDDLATSEICLIHFILVL